MERRTAPPPADGRPRQLGNGGFNKALMPAQAASLSPVKKYSGREMDGNRKEMAVRGLRRENDAVFPDLGMAAPITHATCHVVVSVLFN